MKYENNLRSIMVKKKLTNEKLSEISGLSVDTIGSYSQGRLPLNMIKVDTLLKLCSALKVKPYCLFETSYANKLRKWKI